MTVTMNGRRSEQNTAASRVVDVYIPVEEMCKKNVVVQRWFSEWALLLELSQEITTFRKLVAQST